MGKEGFQQDKIRIQSAFLRNAFDHCTEGLDGRETIGGTISLSEAQVRN